MAQVASCRTITSGIQFWFWSIQREIYCGQRDSGAVLPSSTVFVIQQCSIVYCGYQKDMRTNPGDQQTKQCSFRYRGSLNRKVLSLRGLRSRLFGSHKCWLPPTKSQRPVACPVTAWYIWPSCHASSQGLVVGFSFWTKSEWHSMEGRHTKSAKKRQLRPATF